MLWFSPMRLFAFFCAATVITGCGFQVAGQAPLPEYIDSVRLESPDTHNEVYLALEREFLSRGIEISDDSPNRFLLGEIESGQRILSVSVRNIPREYEVYYTVGYQFRRAGEVLLDRPALTLTRDYVWSELEVLGKAREEKQVRAVIVDDLVVTIMRQLSTLE